jgi:hypothetical protein
VCERECCKGQRESNRERLCVRERCERGWKKRGEVISREGERREER